MHIGSARWSAHLVSLSMVATIACVTATNAADAPEIPAAKELTRYHLGPWERDIGYAQAVRAGNTLYVSGTVGRGDPGDPEAMEAAIRMAYDRIRQTLDAHGTDFRHVVKETVYTRDIEALKAAAPVRLNYYDREHLPASTWVQIDRLFEEGFLIEVEVTAVIP